MAKQKSKYWVLVFLQINTFFDLIFLQGSRSSELQKFKISKIFGIKPKVSCHKFLFMFVRARNSGVGIQEHRFYFLLSGLDFGLGVGT